MNPQNKTPQIILDSIRRDYESGEHTYQTLRHKYGVSFDTVSRACQGVFQEKLKKSNRELNQRRYQSIWDLALNMERPKL